jgi:low affinity Fe/Cu permease
VVRVLLSCRWVRQAAGSPRASAFKAREGWLMSEWFTRFAHRASVLAGQYYSFLVALGLIVVWAASGPFFGFSETWQLLINTTTTIVTFLMVFLIQNTQNRDAMAMHLKLDEVIRSIDGADNILMRAEDVTSEELEELKRAYEALNDAHDELKSRLQPAFMKDAEAGDSVSAPRQ